MLTIDELIKGVVYSGRTVSTAKEVFTFVHDHVKNDKIYDSGFLDWENNYIDSPTNVTVTYEYLKELRYATTQEIDAIAQHTHVDLTIQPHYQQTNNHYSIF